MIKVADLKKEYVVHKLFEGLNILGKKEVPALMGIDMEIRPGRITGLVGPNGSGKTTLMKRLAGIILSDSGSILLNDTEVSDDSRALNDATGWVNGEERSFYWRLTLLENLRFFMGIFGDRADEDKIREILEILGLTPYGNRAFRMLSSGMKARAQIARALLKDPHVLLLDEPFSNIDGASREVVKTFLKDWVIKNKRAILISSHHTEELVDWLDLTYSLDSGRITGTVSGVKRALELKFTDGSIRIVDMDKLKTISEDGGEITECRMIYLEDRDETV